jgi:Ca-activated chloride channel family protein
LEVQDVYPRRIPDLFVGQPVILTGRFRGTGETTILVSGNIGGRIETMRIPIRLDDQTPAHGGLRPVWARAKLEDLADRAIYEQNPDLPSEVKQIALEYGLMSPYTAFVAVDSSHRTAGETGTTLVVPVAMPEGVSYQTTVTE